MDADSIRTASDLIDAFGGATAFSKVIEKGVSTASEMKRAGRIDTDYWDKIIAAAPESGINGLDYAALVRMQAKRANGDVGRSQPAGARQ